MTASDQWKQGIQGVRSSLKVKLMGGKFDETTTFLSITTPWKVGYIIWIIIRTGMVSPGSHVATGGHPQRYIEGQDRQWRDWQHQW
jgi:hypothetical protein